MWILSATARITRWALPLTILAALFAGCGGKGGGQSGPSRNEVAQAVADRLGADDAQAGCTANYLFEDYDADELRVIVDEGMGGLPQPRWEPYLTATLACLTQPLDGR